MGQPTKKPIGRFLLFMLQMAEPIQLILLGGSQMAYLRWTAELEHQFVHHHVRMELIERGET